MGDWVQAVRREQGNEKFDEWLEWLTEEDCADAVVGVPMAVSESEASFLDVIGNNNGSYDVGDFRAYLVRTGVVDGS